MHKLPSRSLYRHHRGHCSDLDMDLLFFNRRIFILQGVSAETRHDLASSHLASLLANCMKFLNNCRGQSACSLTGYRNLWRGGSIPLVLKRFQGCILMDAPDADLICCSQGPWRALTLELDAPVEHPPNLASSGPWLSPWLHVLSLQVILEWCSLDWLPSDPTLPWELLLLL